MEPSLDAQLENLFHRHAAGLGSYFLARTGDPELAEELTSRVFVLAVERIGQCRDNPAGWLFAVAQSVFSRRLRELRRPAPPARAPEQRDPGSAAEARELYSRLTEVIAELNEQQQQIVYLKYFQDMGNSEIAKSTGLTPVHVAVVLHRALKRLREMLDALDKDEAKEGSAWLKHQNLPV